jgi:penicillin-binding protein 1C
LPTAQLPLPLQRFRPRGAVVAQDGPRIAFPPDGAVVEGPDLAARVTEGRAPFTWLANGAPVAVSQTRQVALPPLGRGFSLLTVIDADGLAAQTRIEMR